MNRPWWVRPVAVTVALTALVVVFVTTSVVRDRTYAASAAETELLYVPSGEIVERMALSFDSLVADIYWIRVIQYYGGTKRSESVEKNYDLLGPLLDITTTLDPGFKAAYRFGAIFLTESYPNGPGRSDLAVALLEKGIDAMPDRWEYYMDIGFIYYWWLQDYETAGSWFERAAEVPGASWWLRSLAANTLAAGGSLESSRMLWQQVYDSADNNWIRTEAARRLTQLRALDDINQLIALAVRFNRQAGRPPRGWDELIQAGLLARLPLDPTGLPYVLDVENGAMSVSPESELYPLPGESLPPLSQ